MRTNVILIATAFCLAACSVDGEAWYSKWPVEVTPAVSALATRGVWLAKAPYQITLDGTGSYEICMLKRPLRGGTEVDRCETGLVEYRSDFRVVLLDFQGTEIGSQLINNAGSLYGMDDVNVDTHGEPIPEGAYDFAASRSYCKEVPCHNAGTSETDRYLFRMRNS
jgi:hypothetical protein